MSNPPNNWAVVIVALIGLVGVIVAAVISRESGERAAIEVAIAATTTAEARLATSTMIQVQDPTSKVQQSISSSTNITTEAFVLTATNTIVPLTNTLTSEPIPTTMDTPLAPTLTSEPPTNTPLPPTNTQASTATSTDTPIPSTNTSIPTATFTNTPLPLPPTPIPPTRTFIPTNTPRPATATPTVTPTQLRKLAESDYGALLYEENFNKDTEVWVLEGDSVIRDGELRIAPLTAGRFDFDGQPTKYTFSDFIFETQFRHLNPTGSSELAIYLRFQVPPCSEWNCSIQLWVSGDWKALGARRINGDEVERITGNISAPQLSSTEWNKLTVIIGGDEYQVFVNDVFVKSFTDSTYKNGSIILGGGADGTAFDYVRIYALPR